MMSHTGGKEGTYPGTRASATMIGDDETNWGTKSLAILDMPFTAVLDNRIACAHAQSGEVEYLTEHHANSPSADAVVFSPDGQWLAWMEGGQLWITETDR